MLKKIELVVENLQNIIEVNDNLEQLIQNVVSEVLVFEEFDKPVEISVSLVDNEKIREINKEYRNKDAATDVLSFPMLDFDDEYNIIPDYYVGDYNYDEEALMLGDIILSLERAKEQSVEFGHSFEREVGFLTAHSMFHLLGYDHEIEAEGQIMRNKEEAVLQKIGLVR